MTDPDDRPAGSPDPAGGSAALEGLDPAQLRLALAHADRLERGEPPEDEDARAVLAALDRTRDDLARHGEHLVRERPAMPPSVLAALDRSLAAERAAQATGGTDPPSTSPGPRPAAAVLPHRRVRGAVAAALAAVVAAAVVAVLVVTPHAPAPQAGPDTTLPELGGAAGPGALDPALAVRAALGRTEYGPLSDPARRAACLGALGVAPGAVPAGARPVRYQGRPAVLLVLTTGTAARFRVVVVEAACPVGEPLVLADRLVGR